MRHEGTKPEAYLDPIGVPTICTGHTKAVRIGQKKTLSECQELLKEDLTAAGASVARCTHHPITQSQYDALVSFAFNVGGSAFCKSTLVKKLNAGDCLGAANEFTKWNRAGGRVLPGLVKRRAQEREMFLKGCE